MGWQHCCHIKKGLVGQRISKKIEHKERDIWLFYTLLMKDNLSCHNPSLWRLRLLIMGLFQQLIFMETLQALDLFTSKPFICWVGFITFRTMKSISNTWSDYEKNIWELIWKWTHFLNSFNAVFFWSETSNMLHAGNINLLLQSSKQPCKPARLDDYIYRKITAILDDETLNLQRYWTKWFVSVCVWVSGGSCVWGM